MQVGKVKNGHEFMFFICSFLNALQLWYDMRVEGRQTC